jgi:hypothetical protein
MAASIAVTVGVTFGPGPCRRGEVDPVPHGPQVQRLVAHGGEDAATERPVVGRM